jgi:hypothetical protein
MNTLTNRQQDICTYTGLFGALICTTCLIQHIIITSTHWITFVLLGVYLFAILSFTLLGLQKAIAPWLLVANAAFLLIDQTIFILSGVFSLIVFIAFIYSVTVVVVLFMEGFPARLREKARALKEEELAWKDKI